MKQQHHAKAKTIYQQHHGKAKITTPNIDNKNTILKAKCHPNIDKMHAKATCIDKIIHAKCLMKQATIMS